MKRFSPFSSLCLRAAATSAFVCIAPAILLCSGMSCPCWAAKKSTIQGEEKIMVVNIGYDLLLALGEYHELTEIEKHKSVFVDDSLVLVILRIITGFQHEKENYRNLMNRAATEIDNGILLRIDKHISTFKTELMVRRKALEFELLRQKQRQLFLEKQ